MALERGGRLHAARVRDDVRFRRAFCSGRHCQPVICRGQQACGAYICFRSTRSMKSFLLSSGRGRTRSKSNLSAWWQHARALKVNRNGLSICVHSSQGALMPCIKDARVADHSLQELLDGDDAWNRGDQKSSTTNPFHSNRKQPR